MSCGKWKGERGWTEDNQLDAFVWNVTHLAVGYEIIIIIYIYRALCWTFYGVLNSRTLWPDIVYISIYKYFFFVNDQHIMLKSYSCSVSLAMTLWYRIGATIASLVHMYIFSVFCISNGSQIGHMHEARSVTDFNDKQWSPQDTFH